MSADGGSENDLDVDLAAESFHHDSASDNVGLSGGGEDIDFDSFAEADGTLHDHLLAQVGERSEEHTSELQSLMRISYAVFCLKKKNSTNKHFNAPKQTYTQTTITISTTK